MARLRAATAVIPGIRTLLLPVQNLEFTGGRIARAKYQYTLQSGDIDTLYKQGAGDGARDGAIAGPARRQQRPADHQSADARRHRPRQGGRVRHHRPIRCAPRSTTPIGTRQISTIFTEADDYQVILEASRGVPERHRRARPHPRLDARPAQLVPLDEIATMTAHGRAAADQPPGAAAGGDDLVQSRARHVARPGDRGDPRARAQGQPARPASSPASPATRNCSSRRSRARARCCSPRC